jgi:hypothetical protein
VSRQVDRKQQEVAVAEFQYRHEAEMAAGFLADAGIPFRLQSDDAGGADLGLSMLRPAVLWVRAVDAEVALDLVGIEAPQPDVRQPVMTTIRSTPARPGVLTALERAVAGGLAIALLAVAPTMPPFAWRTPVVVGCFVTGFTLLGAAAVGRAPEALAGLLRVFSGSATR